MFHHSNYLIPAKESALGRLIGKSALMAMAIALMLAPIRTLAQTWYWNPAQPQSGVPGALQQSDNWTSQADGSGPWPKSGLDDDFTADALAPAWTIRAYDNDPGKASINFDNDQLTLTGKGADIWTGSTQFTAVSRKAVTGNFDVAVKVVSQGASDEWAKAGILVFNDFTKQSLGGTFAVIVTPMHGASVQYDSAGAIGVFDAQTYVNVASVYPVWLRAARQGNVISGYYKKKATDPWILIRSATPQLLSDSSQIGLSVTSHNTSIASAVSFDDFQSAGNIASGDLDLSFAGTSPSSDLDARLGAPLSAHGLDLSGYTGTFSFGASALSLSGDADFSTQSKIEAGTGALAFTGAGPQSLTPRAGAVFPNIVKAGAGTLKIAGNPLGAGVLSLQAGAIDLGGGSHEFAGLVPGPGGILGMDAGDTLTFTGDAGFTGITGLPALGTVQIRSAAGAAARTVQFDPGSAAFPNLCLWSRPGAFAAKIVVAAGSLQVKGNLVLRDEKTAAGALGTLDFKSNNPKVSVDGDIQRAENGAAGAGTQQLLLGGADWTAKGNVSLSFANGGERGTGSLDLAAAAPALQILTLTGGGAGNLKHSGTGAAVLGAVFSGLSLTQTAGTLDLNGFDVSVTGNISVTKGGAAGFAGLGGRTLHADGSIQLSGQSGDLLDLNPATGWNVFAGGNLNAEFAIISNSTATGPQSGMAAASCVNGNGNTHWTFASNNASPAIAMEPADSTVLAGKPVRFSVSANGAEPLHYQWKKRGQDAVLGEAAEFAIAAVSAADDGALYYCTVSNDFGSKTTRDAKLTVNVPAAFTQEPADLAVLAGEPAVFSALADGTPALSYEWRIAGRDTPVGTGPVLNLPAPTAADNGSLYYCIVTNAFGKDISRQAKLTVNVPATFTREPRDTVVGPGRPAAFFSGAKGTPPLAFTWYRKGDTAKIVSDSTLTLQPTTLADDGALYFCVVSNGFGKDTTRAAKLSVVQAALIVNEPLDRAVRVGKKATFAVTVVGDRPIAYSWRRNSDTATISTDSIYSVDSPQLKDDGTRFTVMVSNAFGKDTSRSALLSVTVCDSAFGVSPDSLTVDEGKPITLKGNAACADSYIWSALSGPAPKILDPQAFSLAVTAPRVKSDTQIVYRFSAEYEDHTENRNVVIMIRNSIPDPSIALPAKASWNGAAPLVLRPTVSNAAALKDVPNAPPLRYLWSLSAQLADTSQAGDSLKLSNPSGDGVMNVTLCMDNGGEANCAVTPVTVSRTSSGLAGFRTRGSDPVSVSGRSLFWRVPGRVRMWNWQGILLWEGRGRAGEITHMNAAAAGALARRRARLELLP